MSPSTVTTPEDVKAQILVAAGVRFAQYGFQKTTMAEIAQDCKMSAANLYRYFENKSDIGAAIAARHFADKEQRWREVIRRPGLSASERLETFTIENMRCVYDEFCHHPRVSELVDVIAHEHWDLIQRHLDTNRALLAEVLAEGNRSGEFDVPDVVTAAEFIQMATAKFCTPLMMLGKHSIEELDRLARGVVGLLIRGLSKR